jgi:hypothetical protein
MASQGAALQNHNNELVKCTCTGYPSCCYHPSCCHPSCAAYHTAARLAPLFFFFLLFLSQREPRKSTSAGVVGWMGAASGPVRPKSRPETSISGKHTQPAADKATAGREHFMRGSQSKRGSHPRGERVTDTNPLKPSKLISSKMKSFLSSPFLIHPQALRICATNARKSTSKSARRRMRKQRCRTT